MPFSRNTKIFPTCFNGFAYQNGTALIGQLYPAKWFYIFTDLISLHDLAKKKFDTRESVGVEK